jgi:undecaprenyl-diphosphatase
MDQIDAEAPSALTERYMSTRRPWPLIVACMTAIAMLALFWFGQALMSGRGANLDRAIMLMMRVPGHPARLAGPDWLPSAVRDMTALGSSTVLTLVVVVTASFLALRGRWRSASLVVAGTTLGAFAVLFVKALVGRARPDLIERLMVESSHSFPSGHAANSAIVYLTVAALLCSVVERHLRPFLLAVALVLVAAIGISRLYLGVHWPSDVLAGWVFGSLWALLWWRIQVAPYGAVKSRDPVTFGDE